MELPVKQKQTKNWCRLSSLTPVTNNKRLYEQADPWIRLNTWVLTNSASESHCTDLGFFLFFHLWKLIQSHTSYFPQNSTVRHKRHLVLSQNCSWLISPVVKAWVQLKLKWELFWAEWPQSYGKLQDCDKSTVLGVSQLGRPRTTPPALWAWTRPSTSLASVFSIV